MGTVELKEWTIKDPLNCIGYNAGVCWNAPTDSDHNVKRALGCIKDGHGRVEELPDVYVVLDGWSAKCLRELYTHIGGAPTRMQASTRYIDYEKNFNIVMPPSVEKNEEAKKVWNETIAAVQQGMTKLKELEVPKEDYTNLLPLAYESKMIWKVNLRTLINFFGMRLCNRAYWEIRQLSKQLKDALAAYSPEWKIIADELFLPKCEQTGYCTERQCCGRKPKKEDVLNSD